jgi:methyltransferase (TIGR00027 family)
LEPGQPSFTAMRAAAHRAAHQLAEGGRVFADPFAARVLGESVADVFGAELDAPTVRGMRLHIAARSAFAEAALADAVARGVRQYVLLGAGLDTFALRNPYPRVRVFEVDHPATQGWKRRRLADAGLAAPEQLTFAPIDFERTALGDGLAAAGFDAAAPAFFAWLGVIVYLTPPAIEATLRFIAGVGGEVAFDYGEPISAYPPEVQAREARRGLGAAARGEPWISRFMPQDLARLLGVCGFTGIEDLGPAEIAQRFLGVARPPGPGGHLVRARASLLDGAGGRRS